MGSQVLRILVAITINMVIIIITKPYVLNLLGLKNSFKAIVLVKIICYKNFLTSKIDL